MKLHFQGEINRVILQQSIYENDGSTDYINALYVNVSMRFKINRVFFLAQCPHNKTQFFHTYLATLKNIYMHFLSMKNFASFTDSVPVKEALCLAI